MVHFKLNKDIIFNKLQEIVGPEFASNKLEDLFIYSQDPGASIPRHVDFIVMPKSVREIQQIIRFANENQTNLIPMGGGLTLSGLTIPVKGGIVLDLKRMDRIININETSRYALIEAGVTSGQLKAYLEENYPTLQASIPDAPPSVTIAGNVLIHGSGFLSQKYGNHGDMINGLEVVLPNGELVRARFQNTGLQGGQYQILSVYLQVPLVRWVLPPNSRLNYILNLK